MSRRERITEDAPLCKVHAWRGWQAVARVSWTTYGAAQRSQYACEQCVRTVKGQRGVSIKALPQPRRSCACERCKAHGNTGTFEEEHGTGGDQ